MGDEITEVHNELLHKYASSQKDEFTFTNTCELKSKKSSSSTIFFCLGRNKIYFLDISKKKVEPIAISHLYNVTHIKSKKSDSMTIETKDNGKLEVSSPRVDGIINSIRNKILGENFPGLSEEQQWLTFEVPEDRLNPVSKIDRPCGNFRNAYVCECEYLNIPIREDIAFDIEHLLSSNNVKEFNLAEFDQPLSTGDVKALLGALKWNNYFTSFKLREFKIEKDHVPALLACFSNNTKIDELILSSLQTPKEFFVDLLKEMTNNKKCAITTIDFRDNPNFGDSGAIQLGQFISQLEHGISYIDLSNNGIRGKGIASICNALKKVTHNLSSLSYINLSKNRLESDGSSALSSFIAQPNALSKIYLRDSNCNMDIILGALNRGSCLQLKEIDLSHNKLEKYNPLSIFIKSSSSLQYIDLSHTQMSPDGLPSLFASIKENPYITHLTLILSNNGFRSQGAQAIGNAMSNISNIYRLDIADNGFDDDSMITIINSLSYCSSLKVLDISRNLSSKGSRTRDAAIESLINLATYAECQLDSLSICGGKGTQIPGDIIKLIDAFADSPISSLDISGHGLGNKGASALGKLLQSNTKLTSLKWDENGTTLPGFKNFRKGLKRNVTLKALNLPYLDIDSALQKESNKEAFIKVIREIEESIIANNASKSKFKAKEAKSSGTEFLFFSTSQREELEKLILKLRSKGKRPTEEDNLVIKDAENFESVVADLHFSKANFMQNLETSLSKKLQEIVKDVMPVISEQIQSFKTEAKEVVEKNYKTIDPTSLRTLSTNLNFICKEVEEKQIHDILVGASVNEICLAAEESFTSAVDICVDYFYEKITDNLIEITERLQNEAEEAKRDAEKKKKKKTKDHEKRNSRASDGEDSKKKKKKREHSEGVSESAKSKTEDEETTESTTTITESTTTVTETTEQEHEEPTEYAEEEQYESNEVEQETEEETVTIEAPISRPPDKLPPPTPKKFAPKTPPPPIPKVNQKGPPPEIPLKKSGTFIPFGGKLPVFLPKQGPSVPKKEPPIPITKPKEPIQTISPTKEDTKKKDEKEDKKDKKDKDKKDKKGGFFKFSKKDKEKTPSKPSSQGQHSNIVTNDAPANLGEVLTDSKPIEDPRATRASGVKRRPPTRRPRAIPSADSGV